MIVRELTRVADELRGELAALRAERDALVERANEQYLEQATEIAALREALAAEKKLHEREEWELACQVEPLRSEIAALRGQLEVERMRLACCGVIASSNTRASAEAARSVKPEYWSGSAGDVADAVDREMALRDDLAALRERLVEADYELSGEAMHEAGLTYRTVRVGVEWYDAWRASPEVVRALEEKR